VLEYLDIIPIILPTPITVIMLYNFLLSKNNSTDLSSLVGITNLIIVSYVFGGIYIIREVDMLWIPIFSFYLTINLSYYFFYFSSKKRHEKKYKNILFNR
jgi:hypothetical protein